MRDTLPAAGTMFRLVRPAILLALALGCADAASRLTAPGPQPPDRGVQRAIFTPNYDPNSACDLGGDHFDRPFDLIQSGCDDAQYAGFQDQVTTWEYTAIPVVYGRNEDVAPTGPKRLVWATFERRHAPGGRGGERLVQVDEDIEAVTIDGAPGYRVHVAPFTLRFAPELAAIKFHGYVGVCDRAQNVGKSALECWNARESTHDEPLFCIDNLPAGEPGGPWSEYQGGVGVCEALFDTSDPEVFDWNAFRLNQLPTAVIGTPTVQAASSSGVPDGSITVGGGTSSDPEGRALSYAWTLTGEGQHRTASGPFVTFAGLPAGRYALRLAVSDPGGGLDAVAVRVTVTGGIVNRAPSVSGSVTSTTPSTISRGGSVSLTAIGTDPDGDALTYTWQLGGSTQSGASATFAGLAAGSYTARVTVADPSGAAGTADVAVTIAPLTATIFGPASMSANAIGTWEVSLTPAGSGYTYRWVQATTTSSPTLQDGPSPTITASAGTTSFVWKLYVSHADDGSPAATAGLNVTVSTPTPSVSISGPSEVQPGSSCTWSAKPRNVTESYTIEWYVASGGPFLHAETGSFYTHYAWEGPLTLRVKVMGSSGVIAQSDRVVTVHAGAPAC